MYEDFVSKYKLKYIHHDEQKIKKGYIHLLDVH